MRIFVSIPDAGTSAVSYTSDFVVLLWCALFLNVAILVIKFWAGGIVFLFYSPIKSCPSCGTVGGFRLYIYIYMLVYMYVYVSGWMRVDKREWVCLSICLSACLFYILFIFIFPIKPALPHIVVLVYNKTTWYPRYD